MPRTRSMPKVGIVLPIADQDDGNGVPAYSDVREVALAAEASGFDSVWAFDHLLFRGDDEESGIHECWTILAAIAEATRRVELAIAEERGELTRRQQLAARNTVTTAANLFDNMKAGDVKTINLIIKGDVQGSVETLAKTVTDHGLTVEEYTSILVAAKGPRMLELAARHADAWNLAWFGLPDERLARVRRELLAACERVGRDPAEIEITVGITVRYGAAAKAAAAADPPRAGLAGTSRAIADGLLAHVEGGASHLIVSLEPATPATVAELADAVGILRAETL